jgi:uncharacterized membrane protein YukC
MDVGGVVAVSKAIATPAQGQVASGGKLAALQARLKVLFKTVKEVGLNSSLDTKTKKMLMQSLQAEIQIVMLRIAELQSGDKRKGAPIDAVAQARAEAENDELTQKNKDKQDQLLQNIMPGSRIDIAV